MTNDIERGEARSLVSTVEFNVLGPVTVADGTETLNIGGPKQRTVLSMLIAHYGRSVSNDVLAEAVYGDDATPRNRRNVQTYVSTLRSVLGDVIKKQGKGWYLDVDRSSIDALAFEDLYESARQSRDAAARILREALAIWRGHPYYDIEAHGRLDPEITRLNELRIAAQQARIDADLEAGRHADLIGEIEGLLAEHPYTERFRAQHMVALYRAGRQREALRSYETMRSLLVDELGVDPTPDLQDLERRILDQDSSLDAKPQRQIQTKAIVVVDPGDPMALARLPTERREQLLLESSEAVRQVASASEGSLLFPAGTATYAVFNDIGEAAQAAEKISRRFNDLSLRIAVDFGDIEVTDGGVGGAPVSRASVLVSVAHQGQVLLSSEAQRQLVSEGEGTGLRFESLGRHELIGVETPTSVYQLLVGDPPKTFPPLETDHMPAPLPSGGDRSVPGYELREPIGAGSIGTLYRAYQPSVGREVMVEVIGRSEASDADFIRRFGADAQRLSLLEHPNIADLLDYWRDPEGAYLVYRFYRGGTLDVELAGDANRIVEQIGSALQYAHSYGLVHGSLRPDRVMLDESDNAYLLGFPIAGSTPQSSAEHPAYIAPETLTGAPPSVSTDVYALGVLAHELTSGRVESDRGVVPSDSAISRALNEDPELRDQSIADFLRAWAPATDRPETRLTESRNPYKGLAAFHESDADDFFGRNGVVADLVEAVAENRFVAVVGPSGVGKSSVVRAGLIPALRNGAVSGSDEWVITDLLPGPRPFIELERSLERVAVDLIPEIRGRIADHDANALASVGRALPDGSEVLILVDQFEELFTMTDESTAFEFLELIQTATEAGQARFVVTLRADFMDRPLLYSGFGELLGTSLVTVRSPSPDELGAAISEPARGAGVSVDPGLVERIVSEVHDSPGALPLLQHALSELFVTRTSDLMTIPAYEETGGVTGSLAKRAEGIYAALADGQRSAAKQVLLRIVAVAEDSAPTRRRIRIDELADLDASLAVEKFTKGRLLVADIDPDTRTPTIEVAHEALLVHWPRLAGWIETAREDLTMSRRLEAAMSDWEANGLDDSLLLTGGRLAQHESWTQSTSLVLTPAQVGFLERSRAHDSAVTRSRRKRRQFITAGFAAAAVVASLLSVLLYNSSQGSRSRELAAESANALDLDSELAVLLAIQAGELDLNRQSLSALHTAIQNQRVVATLQWPPEELPLGFFMGPSISPDGELVALAGGTDLVEVYHVDDPTTPLWSRRFDFEDAEVRGPIFSTDGEVLVVTAGVGDLEEGPEPPVGVYGLDARTGAERFHLKAEVCGVPFFMLRSQEFVDLNSSTLLLGERPVDGECDGDAWWEVDFAAQELRLLDHLPMFEGENFQAFGSDALSPDGSTILFGYMDQLGVQDVESGEITEGPPGPHAGFSPDGTKVIAGNDPVLVLDASTWDTLYEIPGSFWSFKFSADGTFVYGGKFDGTSIDVFDAETGHLVTQLKGVLSNGTALSADNTRMLAAMGDAQVFDIGSETQGELALLEFGSEPVHRNASRLDIVGDRAITWTWNLEDNSKSTILFDPVSAEIDGMHPGWGSALSPDGQTFFYQPMEELVATDDEPSISYLVGQPIIAEYPSGETLVTLEGFCSWFDSDEPAFGGKVYGSGTIHPGDDCDETRWADWIVDAAFSEDGSRLALVSLATGSIGMWDTSTGELLWRETVWPEDFMEFLASGFKLPVSVAISPDGTRVATGSTSGDSLLGLLVLDAADGGELARVPALGSNPFYEMEFSSDGALLFASDQANHLKTFRTDDWTELEPLIATEGEGVRDFAISPDGTMVVSAGDALLRGWSTEDRSLLFEIEMPNQIRAVGFADDSTLVVLPQGENVAAFLTLDPDALLDVARSKLTRGFTSQECATYILDPCPTLEEMKTD